MKFSFERYKGASATLLKEKVKEVQVAGPTQIRFVLKEPWPDFMLFYGTTASGAGWIVPKHYVDKVGEDGFKKAPIGAGPYKVVSFTPGVELVLEAFDQTGYTGYLTFEYFHPYLYWPEALVYQTSDSLDRMLGRK